MLPARVTTPPSGLGRPPGVRQQPAGEGAARLRRARAARSGPRSIGSLATSSLPGGASVRTVVTHFHHLAPDEASRRQAATLLDGSGTSVARRPTILMGDFNADPTEPATPGCRCRVPFGLRRGQRHGTRGDLASGLQGPAIDTDGEPRCLDYIWVRGPIRVVTPGSCSTAPIPTIPGLFPSDHLGIATHLEIG